MPTTTTLWIVFIIIIIERSVKNQQEKKHNNIYVYMYIIFNTHEEWEFIYSFVCCEPLQHTKLLYRRSKRRILLCHCVNIPWVNGADVIIIVNIIIVVWHVTNEERVYKINKQNAQKLKKMTREKNDWASGAYHYYYWHRLWINILWTVIIIAIIILWSYACTIIINIIIFMSIDCDVCNICNKYYH